ncbi:MAG: hypothetical protein ACRCYY_21260 [Trueperaceae bacterium]
MLYALGFLGAGVLVIGVRSIWRTPGLLETWLFLTVVVLLAGLFSLGMTGSTVAQVMTPLLNLAGLPSTALKDSWLGAMALSVLCPIGFVPAHGLARTGRSIYGLLFIVSLFIYCLIASVGVYFIVERI